MHRALRDKFALGLFEHPYASEDPIEINEVAGRGGELAVSLANQSVTLLKNDDHVLPLAASTRKIAVLGPHAESAYTAFAAYTQPAGIELMKVMMSGGMGNMAGLDDTPTDLPEEVAAEAAEAMAAFMSIDLEQVVRGAYGAQSLTDALRDALPAAEIASVVTPLRDEEWDSAEALRAAADADVVILALGGRSSWLAGAVGGTEGEGVDTADIDLPAIQVRLAQEAARLGKPVIAVVQMGRPYALSSIEDSVSAIVTAYFGGGEQGRAVASVLTGAANPGGKLPFTMPAHDGSGADLQRSAPRHRATAAARPTCTRATRTTRPRPCTRSGTACRTRRSSTAPSSWRMPRSRHPEPSRRRSRSRTPARWTAKRSCRPMSPTAPAA